MPKGTVKWFNNAKGYGFIIEDGHSEDLFAHFSSIQMEGYKTLKAGQSVNFDKQPGDKGFHAVNITAAETASPACDNNVDHDEFISVDEPDSSAFRTEHEESSEIAVNTQQTVKKSATA